MLLTPARWPEFDLAEFSRALGSVAEYDPEKYPGMHLRMSDDGPLITVYRTGKYIVRSWVEDCW